MQRLPRKVKPTILAETYSFTSTNAGNWNDVTEDDEIAEEVHAVMNSTMMDYFTKPPSDVSSLHSEVHQHKKKVILQGSEQSSYTADQQMFLHLWDCGGDPAFLDILPVYVGPRTIFVLVFNASETIDVGLLPRSKFTTVTTQSVLHKWMALIYARYRDSTLPNSPRVVLVGTHADQIAPDRPHEEQKRLASRALDELLASIKTKECADMVLGGVVVDNTTAGMGLLADPGFKKIRQIVYSFVHDKLTINAPVSWIHFRKVLQVAKKQKPLMQLEEVYSIAAECCIPKNEVSSALKLFCELGDFLFYPGIESLKSVVFLEPQWLVDQLGKLFLNDWNKLAKDEDLQNTVTQYGILVEPFYNTVPEHVREHNLTPSVLMEMLEHFLLAVPIANTGLSTSSSKGEEYFVPHMIKRHYNRLKTYLFSSGIIGKTHDSSLKKATPVRLLFSSGYVPLGYFIRLAISLASKQGVMVLFHPIYCDQITMDIGVDRLIITEFTETIGLEYSRIAAISEPFRESCRRLLLLLNSCFTEIHQRLPGTKPQLALSCSRCARHDTPAKFCPFTIEHSIGQHLHCQMNHISLPTHAQQYWLHYEMNAIECDQAQFEV